MVEIQLNPCSNVEKETSESSKKCEPLPFSLMILFAVCTTLLVGIHMLALLISTCILPNLDAVSNIGHDLQDLKYIF